MLHAELLPVSGTSVESLDMERIRDYLQNVILDPDIPESGEEWVRRLLGLGFLAGDVATVTPPVCTIAGLLLFGRKPRRYLRHAGIRVMVFDGIEKDYRSKLDETLDLPMVGFWTKDAGGERRLAVDGIVERVVQVLKPFISEESEGINETMRRERKWHYPLEAVREIFINALAHRDWTRFVDVEITCYLDRLEVISPGAMQNSMTVDKMVAGQRSPRNILIAEVLRDYGYVDARGMGVRTKVIPLMKSRNGVEPIFESTEDYLKTILRRRAEP